MFISPQDREKGYFSPPGLLTPLTPLDSERQGQNKEVIIGGIVRLGRLSHGAKRNIPSKKEREMTSRQGSSSAN